MVHHLDALQGRLQGFGHPDVSLQVIDSQTAEEPLLAGPPNQTADAVAPAHEPLDQMSSNETGAAGHQHTRHVQTQNHCVPLTERQDPIADC
jgi:hypothetical protein